VTERIYGNIPTSNDEAMMTKTAYHISDLPVGKTKAYQEIREGRLRFWGPRCQKAAAPAVKTTAKIERSRTQEA
jgi:hypothetical protein